MFTVEIRMWYKNPTDEDSDNYDEVPHFVIQCSSPPSSGQIIDVWSYDGAPTICTNKQMRCKVEDVSRGMKEEVEIFTVYGTEF